CTAMPTGDSARLACRESSKCFTLVLLSDKGDSSRPGPDASIGASHGAIKVKNRPQPLPEKRKQLFI
ncbi:MAG TPA: hypothetical protein PLA98_15740, partial [Alicycliphilus sp.]|nr:hypothetical protein [Alicycliphilus sp.]